MERLNILKKHIRYYISCGKIVLEWYKKSLALKKRSINKKIREYPLTIQLPITYKCNFNCKMCGMQNLLKNKDFSSRELEAILKDRLFCKVTSVGLNGGEPFLRKDLVDCVRIIIDTLPKLKTFNIITNGYFTDSIKEKLLEINRLSKQKNIDVNISLSIDGIEKMQDLMRGHQNAWRNVVKTIAEIKADEKKYCDSLGVICTVTRYNVFNLEEVEAWSKKNNIFVRYNIATLNARIDNEDRFEDFSIFCDEKARMMAQEFFYKKAIQERSETYFGIYLYIRYKNRYADCPCKYNEWVTLVPNGNISYCATYSKELGSALKKSAYDLFNDNIAILKEIRDKHCCSCSHYISQLDSKGLRLFYIELLKNNRILF